MTQPQLRRALRAKQAQLEVRWGVNRKAATRRYKNAYQSMLRAARDSVGTDEQYVELLYAISLKSLAAPAERSEKTMLKYGWDKLLSFVTRTTAETPKKLLTEEQFATFTKQVHELYEKQQADLKSLQKTLADHADQLRNASPFDDSTYGDALRDMITGRTAALRTTYEQALDALLKEYGITTMQLGT